MSIKSEYYFWVTCDVKGCGARCPDPDSYEHSAWSQEQDAEQCAEDSGWQVLPPGSAWSRPPWRKHLCPEHCYGEED